MDTVFLDAGAIINLARDLTDGSLRPDGTPRNGFDLLDPNTNFVTTRAVESELGGFVVQALDQFRSGGRLEFFDTGDIDFTSFNPGSANFGVALRADGSFSQRGDASIRWLQQNTDLFGQGNVVLWTNDGGLISELTNGGQFFEGLGSNAVFSTSIDFYNNELLSGRISADEYTTLINTLLQNNSLDSANPFGNAGISPDFKDLAVSPDRIPELLALRDELTARPDASSNSFSNSNVVDIANNTRLLSAIGVAGDVLEVGIAIQQATNAIQQGGIDGIAEAELHIAGAFGSILGGTAGGAAGGSLAVAVVAFFVPEPSTTLIGAAAIAGALIGGAAVGGGGQLFAQFLTEQLQNTVANGGSITSALVTELFVDYAIVNGIDVSSLTVVTNPNGQVEIAREGECFLAGTAITLRDGSKRFIEKIQLGDEVLSYDDNGRLVPAKVTKLFQNNVHCVLDVHGLMVTPGHVTYCADGQFCDQHVPIIDIILSDGALMRENGERFRVATNEVVGSELDQFVILSCAFDMKAFSERRFTSARVRLGTKIINANGDVINFWDMLSLNGFGYDPESELVINSKGRKVPMKFLGSSPKPEDYILAKSGLTLAEIYNAGEWREDHAKPAGVFAARVSVAQN